MNKNRLAAFFLGFIPGMGHMFLRKFGRGFLYPFIVLGLLLLGFLVEVVTGGGYGDLWILFLLLAVVVWVISMLDLIITLLTLPPKGEMETAIANGADHSAAAASSEGALVSGTSIALAFIPGVGHMHMGLMMRGLTILIAFFGILTMVFFVSVITGVDSFLVFLAALPILWVYNLFDAMQLYNRKSRGETLEDRTIFDELAEQREQGRKSKILAMFLALMPGAGHMYLGLQKRGLQLMAAFLLSIYILDALRLSLFLFLIPILWFFSFFDALQRVSDFERGEAHDVPVVDWLIHHQKWVGIGLVATGLIFLFDRVGVPLLSEIFPNLNFRHIYQAYLQTTVVSAILIFGGIKLLASGRGKEGGEK